MQTNINASRALLHLIFSYLSFLFYELPTLYIPLDFFLCTVTISFSLKAFTLYLLCFLD